MATVPKIPLDDHSGDLFPDDAPRPLYKEELFGEGDPVAWRSSNHFHAKAVIVLGCVLE